MSITSYMAFKVASSGNWLDSENQIAFPTSTNPLATMSPALAVVTETRSRPR